MSNGTINGHRPAAEAADWYVREVQHEPKNGATTVYLLFMVKKGGLIEFPRSGPARVAMTGHGLDVMDRLTREKAAVKSWAMYYDKGMIQEILQKAPITEVAASTNDGVVSIFEIKY